jgi:hypothetical protein
MRLPKSRSGNLALPGRDHVGQLAERLTGVHQLAQRAQVVDRQRRRRHEIERREHEHGDAVRRVVQVLRGIADGDDLAREAGVPVRDEHELPVEVEQVGEDLVRGNDDAGHAAGARIERWPDRRRLVEDRHVGKRCDAPPDGGLETGPAHRDTGKTRVMAQLPSADAQPAVRVR